VPPKDLFFSSSFALVYFVYFAITKLKHAETTPATNLGIEPQKLPQPAPQGTN
jgi:hypothetical protein